jgi:hypothetical protein
MQWSRDQIAQAIIIFLGILVAGLVSGLIILYFDLPANLMSPIMLVLALILILFAFHGYGLWFSNRVSPPSESIQSRGEEDSK